MKNIFYTTKHNIIFFFLGIASIASAQQKDSVIVFRNEIGLSVLTWYFTDEDKNVFLQPGMHYKYHFDAFNLKLFAAGFGNKYEFYDFDSMFVQKRERYYAFSAGIEKVFFHGWLQFAEGIDFTVHMETSETINDRGTWNETDIFFGPAVTGGPVVHFGKHLSASAYFEFSLLLKKEEYGIDAEGFVFIPVRALSVNYLF